MFNLYNLGSLVAGDMVEFSIMGNNTHSPITKQPLWYFDDITKQGRFFLNSKYLHFVLLINVLYHAGIYYYNSRMKTWAKIESSAAVFNSLLSGSNDVTTRDDSTPLLNQTSETNYGSSGSAASNGHSKEAHFSIFEMKFDSKDELSSYQVVVKRNSWDFFRLRAELIHVDLLVIANILYQYHFSKHSIVINSVFNALLFINVNFRFFKNKNNTNYIVNTFKLWGISLINYIFMFIVATINFRSLIIHPENLHLNEKRYFVFSFVMTLFLTLNLLTSRIKNQLPILLVESNEDDDEDENEETEENNADERVKSKLLIPSPEPTASVLSFAFWSFLDPFIWLSHKKYINFKDIWSLSKEDHALDVLFNFKIYNKIKKATHLDFSKNLLLFFKKYLLLQAFFAFTNSIVAFVPTVLLRKLLEYVSDQSTVPKNVVWLYVIFMLITKTFSAALSGQSLFYGRRVCIRMRAIIISEVYSKALRRKISVQHKTKSEDDSDDKADGEEPKGDEEEIEENSSLGGIINLMSVDAFKISEVCAYLYGFVEAIVMTVVALTLLYQLIGFASIVGAALILLMSPINFKLMNYLGEMQRRSLVVTDKRIQKLNETFNNIRIIKFFSWEENFIQEITKIREEELKLLLYRGYVWALSSIVWFITPSIVTSSSFAFYIYVQGEILTTPIAFTALSLFTLLKGPLDQFSDMASFVIQSKVSLDRVQKFLNETETDKYEQLTISESKLGFENATLSWNSNDFKLQNLNIDFKIGKLNLVIGETGSGKTSLLMGLLGEMGLLKGSIYVPSLTPKEELVLDPKTNFTNSISYCSQSAWLLNDTVRNNILFSEPFDQKRYDEVIHSCGLTRDLEILVGGDQTEIGEKGLSLSGGQKQRVSLARALYSRSKTLLLDDCLSAVDSHNALWIYENCITGSLMKDRTCILVSHNIALTLKKADWCVVLENGKIKGQGLPVQLLNDGLLGDDSLLKNSILSASGNHLSAMNVPESKETEEPVKKGIDLSKLGDDNKDASECIVPENNETDKKTKGKLVKAETKSNGVVKLEVYLWYGKVFGGFTMIFALCSVFLLANFINISQAWWMRTWASNASSIISSVKNALTVVVNDLKIADKKDAVLLNNVFLTPNMSYASSATITEKLGHSTGYYLLIYFGIGVIFSVFSSLKIVVTFAAGINASRKMFNLLLDNVMFSKLRFFDTTPIGRIMNRFSKDIESVDQDLAPFVEGSFNCLVQCISTIILIAWITPTFLIGAFIIGSLYYALGYFYTCGSRELKRYESITRSPIMQHFSETLVGVSTIRAYGDERRFIKENLKKIDTNNRPFFYLWVANRWLSARIDFIGALVTFFAGCSILLQIDSIDAGLAGISLTYAISFTESALWLVRLYSNVEMCMNSVERLQEYTVIEEEPLNIEAPLPEDPNWPATGAIELNDLSLRYAPNLPKVIKNITFSVKPETSVAVVGRTGAGKSSLLSALFLFLLPETGYVKIDGVDITSIPLKKLRQSIGIIPQDPQMFTGTIKTNLDPYDDYSDEQIFESLRRVNLISVDELNTLKKNGFKKSTSVVDSAESENSNINKFLNLNNAIAEGGANISQGQKQLICLARTLLRQPKVILLDEATASLDYKSDQIIQKTVREEFSNCTIMTIAHRLKTVIDYDKIVVLDNGVLKEYDHPYSLLLNKDSIFYSMCEDSGELDTLVKMAKEAFVKQLNSS
ncbi:hypothetical protein QEN19_003910 [Hanseniaspora menglaensis]